MKNQNLYASSRENNFSLFWHNVHIVIRSIGYAYAANKAATCDLWSNKNERIYAIEYFHLAIRFIFVHRFFFVLIFWSRVQDDDCIIVFYCRKYRVWLLFFTMCTKQFHACTPHTKKYLAYQNIFSFFAAALPRSPYSVAHCHNTASWKSQKRIFLYALFQFQCAHRAFFVRLDFIAHLNICLFWIHTHRTAWSMCHSTVWQFHFSMLGTLPVFTRSLCACDEPNENVIWVGHFFGRGAQFFLYCRHSFFTKLVKSMASRR